MLSNRQTLCLLASFLTALCAAPLSAEELTGTFRKEDMAPARLEIDGGGVAREIEVAGKALKEIPDGARIWIRGDFKTFLELNPAAAQKPSQWHLVMTIMEWKKIEAPFERPEKAGSGQAAPNAAKPTPPDAKRG